MFLIRDKILTRLRDFHKSYTSKMAIQEEIAAVAGWLPRNDGSSVNWNFSPFEIPPIIILVLCHLERSRKVFFK